MQDAQWSADAGRILLVGTHVSLWNAISGERLLIVEPRPKRAFSNAALSADAQNIATIYKSGAVRVWNVRTGKPVTRPLQHRGQVQVVAFSPCTSDAPTGGHWLATGCQDGTARVWNTATGQPATPLLRHAGPVNSVEFSPDGRQLATASADGTVRVWPIPDPTQLSPADLSLQAMLLSSRKGDGYGDLQSAELTEIDAAWQNGVDATFLAVFVGDARGTPIRPVFFSSTLVVRVARASFFILSASASPARRGTCLLRTAFFV